MDIRTIDHVNLKIPANGIDEAIEFYDGKLGLEVEGRSLFERGEKGFFSFRLTPQSVVHVRPAADFRAPTGADYQHLALCVEQPIEQVKDELTACGIEVDRELEPLGATGVAPAVYITDPFGYQIEIKEVNDHPQDQE